MSNVLEGTIPIENYKGLFIKNTVGVNTSILKKKRYYIL